MIRAAVKRRLVEIAQYAMPDVDVHYTWAGDAEPDRVMYVGQSFGAQDPEAIGSDYLPVDRWTIACTITLKGFTDGLEAERAVEEQLARLGVVLRDCRRLNHPDVPPSADAATYSRASSVTIAGVDGPFHSNPQLMGGDTIQGWAEFEISCTADL